MSIRAVLAVGLVLAGCTDGDREVLPFADLDPIAADGLITVTRAFTGDGMALEPLGVFVQAEALEDLWLLDAALLAEGEEQCITLAPGGLPSPTRREVGDRALQLRVGDAAVELDAIAPGAWVLDEERAAGFAPGTTIQLVEADHPLLHVPEDLIIESGRPSSGEAGWDVRWAGNRPDDLDILLSASMPGQAQALCLTGDDGSATVPGINAEGSIYAVTRHATAWVDWHDERWLLSVQSTVQVSD